MKKFLALLLLFTVTASALQITSLKQQAVLQPCQQAVFPFELSGQGSVSLQVKNLYPGLNYSLPSSLNLNGITTLNLPIYYPCDAVVETGENAFTVIATQGSEKAAATSHLFLSPSDSLSISLTGEELACACAPTRFTLELRNQGHKRELGIIIVSSQFSYSIPETAFDLMPGESLSRQIALDLNCSVPAGAYPLSIGVAQQGGQVVYRHAVANVLQCFASQLVGREKIISCHGNEVNEQYAIYNNGLFEQMYRLSSDVGGVLPQTVTLPAHSFQVFNLTIDAWTLPYAKEYNLTIRANSERNSYELPVSLNSVLCENGTMPILRVNYLELNSTFSVSPGRNSLLIKVTNENDVEIRNAVLSLGRFGPISDLFSLAVNETKEVSVAIEVPANFTNSTELLLLESDQGRNGRLLSVQSTNAAPVSGFFVLGGVDDVQLAALAVVIVILFALYYYAETQRRSSALIDYEITTELQAVLDKHKRK